MRMKIKHLETMKNSFNAFDNNVPLCYSFFVYIVLVIITIALVWICFAKIDVTVKAPAVLKLKTNTSIGKTAFSGIVQSKNYTSGMHIKKGDVLLSIDVSDVLADKENNDREYKRLLSDMENLVLYETAVNLDKNSIPPIKTYAYSRAKLYFSKKERLQIEYKQAEAEYTREISLPVSMRTKQTISKLFDRFKIAELDYSTFTAQEIINLQTEKKMLEQKLDICKKLHIQLEKQITESKIISPIDGIVEDLHRLNTGDYVLGGTEILRIIPEHIADLKAEVSISDKDVAELREGLKVTFKFSALPPSEYGTIEGYISNISGDAFNFQNSPAFFLLDVDLAQNTLTNSKYKKIALKPGMTAEAGIIIKRKTIISFILEKLDFIK